MKYSTRKANTSQVNLTPISIRVEKLKWKKVMKRSFWKKYKLKRSCVSLVCRQLLNFELKLKRPLKENNKTASPISKSAKPILKEINKPIYSSLEPPKKKVKYDFGNIAERKSKIQTKDFISLNIKNSLYRSERIKGQKYKSWKDKNSPSSITNGVMPRSITIPKSTLSPSNFSFKGFENNSIAVLSESSSDDDTVTTGYLPAKVKIEGGSKLITHLPAKINSKISFKSSYDKEISVETQNIKSKSSTSNVSDSDDLETSRIKVNKEVEEKCVVDSSEILSENESESSLKGSSNQEVSGQEEESIDSASEGDISDNDGTFSLNKIEDEKDLDNDVDPSKFLACDIQTGNENNDHNYFELPSMKSQYLQLNSKVCINLEPLRVDSITNTFCYHNNISAICGFRLRRELKDMKFVSNYKKTNYERNEEKETEEPEQEEEESEVQLKVNGIVGAYLQMEDPFTHSLFSPIVKKDRPKEKRVEKRKIISALRREFNKNYSELEKDMDSLHNKDDRDMILKFKKHFDDNYFESLESSDENINDKSDGIVIHGVYNPSSNNKKIIKLNQIQRPVLGHLHTALTNKYMESTSIHGALNGSNGPLIRSKISNKLKTLNHLQTHPNHPQTHPNHLQTQGNYLPLQNLSYVTHPSASTQNNTPTSNSNYSYVVLPQQPMTNPTYSMGLQNNFVRNPIRLMHSNAVIRPVVYQRMASPNNIYQWDQSIINHNPTPLIPVNPIANNNNNNRVCRPTTFIPTQSLNLPRPPGVIYPTGSIGNIVSSSISSNFNIHPMVGSSLNTSGPPPLKLGISSGARPGMPGPLSQPPQLIKMINSPQITPITSTQNEIISNSSSKLIRTAQTQNSNLITVNEPSKVIPNEIIENVIIHSPQVQNSSQQIVSNDDDTQKNENKPSISTWMKKLFSEENTCTADKFYNFNSDIFPAIQRYLNIFLTFGFPNNAPAILNAAYQMMGPQICCCTHALNRLKKYGILTQINIPSYIKESKQVQSFTRLIAPGLPKYKENVPFTPPPYNMIILKRFIFAIDKVTRDILYPLPAYAVPNNNDLIDKITVVVLICPKNGVGPGLIVFPHSILNRKLRLSFGDLGILGNWTVSAHQRGGLTHSMITEFLNGEAINWLREKDFHLNTSYMMMDWWWSSPVCELNSFFKNFRVLSLQSLFPSHQDPLDICVSLTMERIWGLLVKRWMSNAATLEESDFPMFIFKVLEELCYPNRLKAWCRAGGLYPIDSKRANIFKTNVEETIL